MRAAIYARVSTTGQGQSPEMQVRELREYCERRGWQIAAEYVDVGISGAKDSRPELNRPVSQAHRRRFDAVVAPVKCTPRVREFRIAHFAGMTCPHFETTVKLDPGTMRGTKSEFFDREVEGYHMCGRLVPCLTCDPRHAKNSWPITSRIPRTVTICGTWRSDSASIRLTSRKSWAVWSARVCFVPK